MALNDLLKATSRSLDLTLRVLRCLRACARRSDSPICSRARRTPSPTPNSSRPRNGSTRCKNSANRILGQNSPAAEFPGELAQETKFVRRKIVAGKDRRRSGRAAKFFCRRSKINSRRFDDNYKRTGNGFAPVWKFESVHVRPHPDPLPRGEGECGGRAQESDSHDFIPARERKSPLPGGEGWG